MSRLTSTRFGISYPNPATRDEPADVPADLALIITNLEAKGAKYNQGTIGTRPAASTMTGGFWYSTDTTKLSYSTGSAWVDIGPVGAGEIGTTQLADGSVTLAKHAANSVDASKIVDGSVGAAEIADGTVTDTEIAAANKDGATGTYSMRRLGTTAGMAAAGTHASQHAAAGADPLPADSITATQIAAGAVDVAELTAAVAQRLMQPGQTMIWPYAEASIPTGFVALYGQAVSRSANPTLNAAASAAGYPHGTGDGSTTFNLVDTRGRTFHGKDDTGGTPANRISVANNGRTVGGTFGAEEVTLTVGQMPVHSHVVNSHSHGGAVTTVGDHGHQSACGGGGGFLVTCNTGFNIGGGGGLSPTLWFWPDTLGAGAHNHGVTAEAPGTNNQGSGLSHPNLGPGIIGIWIIRTG